MIGYYKISAIFQNLYIRPLIAMLREDSSIVLCVMLQLSVKQECVVLGKVMKESKVIETDTQKVRKISKG